MASDLLSIARSGTRAARAALDVTAQNISNASSEGYVRRSVRLEEVSASGGVGRVGDISLSGVRVAGIVRNADLFRQSEVRRTGADFARADAEVNGLDNIQSALEQTRVYESVVQFESSLQQLLSDPTDGSLRASVVEGARTMANTFNVASSSLDAVGQGLRFEAGDGVDQVNLLAGELARVNLRLARAADASSDQSTLLDQRDSLLRQLSDHVDIAAAISPDNTVEVRIGGTAGPQLVAGGTAGTMAMATAADGTISFTLDGNAVTPASGALAGQGQALTKLAQVRTSLDTIASDVIDAVNTAQAAGVDLDGTAGQPLFSGTGASDIAVVQSDGRKLATAPAGAGANSRDPTNLVGLRQALAGTDPAGQMDALLFDVSSEVAGRTVTRDALDSIASTAKVALQAQAGVDLDQEAVNLIRFQQAFQASGRVMQVASDIFDTLLGIR
ncbi:flagellar hook-associated protein FlgK [Novosphingobium album (ex Liu et al. 2023)]|uniref:Flagellar hook-associated protein 1 n=1 Tax=Novosphingobium album (ex Liu et al. 2023) TaxID=3031130 RepID=A0ABT5WM74_9SPHN|nr:flagellar hook-associated protein FlgK [Novosphingobium album (ex Liu et al. 2023)]MDE8651144.1 flagellar hook-associated protein FlgK [Novosphingobium album (ex Liu et al. 2023)]